MMNSSSEQQAEVAGAVHSATPKVKRRKYVPKHAVRLTGEVGVGRLCRCGCGAVLISIGRGRPKEWCDTSSKAAAAAWQARYFARHRQRLLERRKELRLEKKARYGKTCDKCGRDWFGFRREGARCLCIACRREARIEYQREYRLANRDRVNARQSARAKAKRAELRGRLAEAAKGGSDGQPECVAE